MNAILAEVREVRARGLDVISLMRGEPDFPTPPHIVEACTKALREGRTAYPDNRGEPVLREAIAAKLKRDNGLTFNAATEVLVTSGATFGIYAALTALIEEGNEVLLPDPVYDAYRSPILLAGGLPRPVAATLKDGRFTLELRALEEAWRPAAKALILNTPWNPVGTVLTSVETFALSDFCRSRRMHLLSDEIYEAITYDGRPHTSPAGAIHINSFSKTYAMTGWRVGYCAGPPETIARMYAVLAQSSRGPTTFVQYAAAEALNGDQSCVAEMRDEYARRRQVTLDALSGIPRVRVLAPEGGFFVMVDVSGLGISSDEVRRRLLGQNGVAVMHGSAYGSRGEGLLRVSFAAGGSTLSRGLERLRLGLESMSR